MTKILSINAGSSSLKFQLLEMPEGEILLKGQFERIGIEDSFYKIEYNNNKSKNLQNIPNHSIAIEILLEEMISLGVIHDLNDIKGVGHRVTHGGERYKSSVLIDDDVIHDIEQLAALAPIHNPANLVGIRVFKSKLKNCPQVAVFDTAFHQTLEDSRFLYPIPLELYHKHHIRKYGFHGTSHSYIAQRYSELKDSKISDLNIISLHLGNGASITAIKGGKSINTSMGFTPLAGLMMGTRSGDVDPSIIPFIMENEGLDTQEVLHLLNHESGMLGISGISSDAREVLDAYENGDARAELTIELYANKVCDYIGSYFIQLGKVDAIIFTGGIGENACLIRSKIIEKCSNALEIQFDKKVNSETFGSERELSTKESNIEVWVIPTDEEYVIANDTLERI